jgi:NDP-sugar pyrophosphorylase family protein
MILAAGIGSRLWPLTDKTPKALLEFRGKPMLDHVVEHLTFYGITEIVINIHHLADQIVNHVRSRKNYGVTIEFSDETDRLMDTGGGILKARWFLQDHGPFIVHNVDIFSDLHIEEFYNAHMEQKPLATLAVKRRDTSRNLLLDAEEKVIGWRDNRSGEIIMAKDEQVDRAVAFSGIHVIDPAIFTVIAREDPFSMTRAYLELAKTHPIHTVDHSDGEWIDMAHPDNFRGLLN